MESKNKFKKSEDIENWIEYEIYGYGNRKRCLKDSF